MAECFGFRVPVQGPVQQVANGGQVANRGRPVADFSGADGVLARMDGIDPVPHVVGGISQ